MNAGWGIGGLGAFMVYIKAFAGGYLERNHWAVQQQNEEMRYLSADRLI